MKKQYLLQLAFILIACIPSFAEDAKSPFVSGTITSHASAISFIENKGQIADQDGHTRNDIQFKLPATKGLNIFISSGHLHYQWYQPESKSSGETSYRMYRMDIELMGANPDAEATRSGIQPYYEMHYTPATGINGCRANTFSKITYENIYPNIDWVLYTRDGKLKHEFIVKKGGNAADIRIKYDGATTLKINADGSLTASTSMGTINETAPISFTETNKNVASSFVIIGNIISYNIASYTGTLTIDPNIEWGTYYGGTSSDYIYNMAIDPAEMIVCVGRTSSTSNIVTTGAFDTTIAGGTDGMVIKMKKDGTPVWCTYYGGSAGDYIGEVAVNNNSDIFFGGFTESTNVIATAGSYSGSRDAFVAKLNKSGSRIWGRYVGGTGQDYLGGIVTNNQSGDVFVVVESRSSNLATNLGTEHQTTLLGSGDALLARLDNNGDLQMATYFGGSGYENATGITLDMSGNIIITGFTNSDTAISTNGTHQPVYGGGGDVYIASFKPNGSRNWGTYYGGMSGESSSALSADLNNNIYVTGRTNSDTAIATPGTFMDTIGGLNDSYILKLSNSGARIWCSYFGGADDDEINALTIHKNRIIISGSTNSSSGIANNAYQTTFGGVRDGFIARFTDSGQLNWSTYYGGSDDDVLSGVVTDSSGNIYISGYTKSTSGIATGMAYLANNPGNITGYIAMFCDNPEIKKQPGNVAVEAGKSVQYIVNGTSSGLTYQWQADTGTGYQNLVNSGIYSGVNTNTLTVTNVTATNNNDKFRCVVSSGSCVVNSSEASLIVFPLAISSVIKTNVQVYPNPTDNVLNIQLPETIEKIDVYNITGQRFYNVSPDSEHAQIDMSNLAPGIYIIKINGEHVVRVAKQ